MRLRHARGTAAIRRASARQMSGTKAMHLRSRHSFLDCCGMRQAVVSPSLPRTPPCELWWSALRPLVSVRTAADKEKPRCNGCSLGNADRHGIQWSNDHLGGRRCSALRSTYSLSICWQLHCATNSIWFKLEVNSAAYFVG